MRLYVLTLHDSINVALADSPGGDYHSPPQKLGALRVLATALVGTAAGALPKEPTSVAIAGRCRTVHIHPAGHTAVLWTEEVPTMLLLRRLRRNARIDAAHVPAELGPVRRRTLGEYHAALTVVAADTVATTRPPADRFAEPPIISVLGWSLATELSEAGLIRAILRVEPEDPFYVLTNAGRETLVALEDGRRIANTRSAMGGGQ